MSMDLCLTTACGLYCGACSIYRMVADGDAERIARAAERFHCRPEEIKCGTCRGPREENWSSDCKILACTQARGLDFCYPCAEFPCEMLRAFSAERDDRPMANQQRMAEIGPERWRAEQEAVWRCPSCGRALDYGRPVCAAGAQPSGSESVAGSSSGG